MNNRWVRLVIALPFAAGIGYCGYWIGFYDGHNPIFIALRTLWTIFWLGFGAWGAYRWYKIDRKRFLIYSGCAAIAGVVVGFLAAFIERHV